MPMWQPWSYAKAMELYEAARKGDAACVRELLGTSGKTTLLHGATTDGCNNGINVAAANSMTPLCIAAISGHVDVVGLLLDAPGIDVNKQTACQLHI